MNIDQKKLEEATRLFLEGLGLDVNDQHFKNTPARVAKAWKNDFGAGYEMDPAKILTVTFSEDYDEMIVVKDIPVLSYCAHHVVPFFGKAKVGYIPADKRITGLSKLARIVDVFAKRLQVQERLTNQVAFAIKNILQPRGVGVVITATHMCMSHRGVRAVGSETVTSCMIGCFRDEPETRAEFLQF